MREIIFAGQVNNNYLFSNFAKSNKKDKEPKRNLIKGAAYLGGAGVVGQQTIRSGIPRLLGVRLESHSTSRKNAKEILKNGGWLDPNHGGTGASKAINNADYISGSKNNVHITGKHISHTKKIGGGEIKGTGGKKIRAKATYKNLGNNLGRDIFTRKFQKTMYRNLAGGASEGSLLKKTVNIAAAAIGAKGKTLYVGGSDDYFNKNFTPDVDDLALKSTNKVKVQGSRAGATLEALKREGGGSRLRGIARLVKANPSRALAGAGILAGGGLLTAKLGQAAYRNITAPSDGKVKGFSRKNKSGKWSNVKSFIRDKIKK